MSDIKLFRLTGKAVQELEGRSAAVEKSIQTLLEQHLENFLGVRFLASEYATGKTHGGRIDSLGIDENHAPVIIEPVDWAAKPNKLTLPDRWATLRFCPTYASGRE